MNEKHQLGLKLDEQRLEAKLENGSKIFLVGGDERPKVEALRGPKYPRAVVDECGSFPKELLRYLVEEALEPALMDMDGDLWLMGTPNAGCVGYFHDVTTGARAHEEDGPQKIPTHHWTVLDNPYIPHAAQWLEELKKRRKWTDETPRFRREYLAHWVRDMSSLVFRFDRARHLVPRSKVPADIMGVVGVDLGTSQTDRTMAFVVSAWAKYQRDVYTTYAKKHFGMNPTDGGDEVERLSTRFKAHHASVDEGGLGKGYADEWRKRDGLSVQAAEKLKKYTFVDFLNAQLDEGHLFIVDDGETRDLVEEIELLQWNEDRDGYDERFADHASDAWLYGWRDCFAWCEPKPPHAGAIVGSAEWLEAQREARKQQAIKDAAKRARHWRPGMPR